MAMAATPRMRLTSIGFYIPDHTPRLLQQFNTSCSPPLKRAYGHAQVKSRHWLANASMYYIDKMDFLKTFTRIRPAVFTQQNIQAGFQATGLITCNPERVLSSLPVVQTPFPPRNVVDNSVAWTSETRIQYLAQLQQEARYVQELLRRQSQSPKPFASL